MMSTQDALLGYDMVWAITQDTINSQLAWLFSQNLIENVVEFGDLDQDGFHFKGTIDIPEVVLIGGPNSTQGSLIITLLDGEFTYWVGHGPASQQKKALLNDPNNPDPYIPWTLAFNVNLNIAQLYQDLRNGTEKSIPSNKVIPPSILETLTQFHSSNFTIQHIFLDFQNADFGLAYDRTRSNTPTTNDDLKAIIPDLELNFFKWISHKYGTANPFIFGYTACPDFNEQSLFQPTGATFLIDKYQPAGDHDGLSTLCFLMTTQSQTPDLAPPQDRFTTNLLDASEAADENPPSGAGLVAKAIVHSKWIEPYVLPAVAQALESPVTLWTANSDGSWTLNYQPQDESQTYKNADSGIANIYATFSRQTYCTLRLSPYELDADQVMRSAIVIEGYFYRKADFSENLFSVHRSVWAWQSNKLPWSAKIFLKAGDGGTIQMVKQVTQGTPESKHDASDLSKFADLFKAGYGNTLEDVNKSYSSLERQSFDALASNLDKTLDSLKNQVILPAPSVFLYKNLNFTSEGDLRVLVTYNAATAPATAPGSIPPAVETPVTTTTAAQTVQAIQNAVYQVTTALQTAQTDPLARFQPQLMDQLNASLQAAQAALNAATIAQTLTLNPDQTTSLSLATTLLNTAIQVNEDLQIAIAQLPTSLKLPSFLGQSPTQSRLPAAATSLQIAINTTAQLIQAAQMAMAAAKELQPAA